MIFIAGIFGYLTISYLIEPVSSPQNVFVSNITDGQAVISYTTSKSTRGTVIASSKGKFPFLPILATNLAKDDGEANLTTIGFYKTHHITVGKLLKEQSYQYRIYQGWHQVYQGSFKTGAVLPILNTPDPIFGRVVTKNNKTGVAGAIVYLQAGKEASPSSVVSTLTNQDGGWTIDLANLRTGDLKNAFQAADDTVKEILVDAGDQGRVKTQAQSLTGQAWPEIILK